MLIFSETEFNLNTVNYPETVTKFIKVTNNSDQNVELTPSFSSCSCTTASIDKTKLQPLESTTFNIIFNTVKSGIGLNQMKTIDLRFKFANSVSENTQTFRFKANVVNL